jgi:hypothetical protein
MKTVKTVDFLDAKEIVGTWMVLMVEEEEEEGNL